MAAISADPDTVNTMIAAWMQTRPATPAADRVVVAVENHDQQTVVSGPEREIIAFMAACKGKLSAHRLNSPYGFHHPALAPAGAAFAARLGSRPIAHPRRPVYSPIMGRYYRSDDNIAECLARHLVMPVAFSSAVRRLGADNVAVFIECGGLDGLTKIIRRIHGRSGGTAFATFMPNAAYDSGVAPIVDHIKGIHSMNAQVSPSFVDFEAFWKERSPFIMALIRAEFVSFLLLQHQQVRWSPAEMSLPALPVPPGPEPEARQPAAPVAIRQPEQRTSASAARVGRDRLFKELVAIYAEAMEYPPEVFTETVELEAELGIDSVKQTEIMGRLGELYGLPPMPANVRISDFKTMGAVVDLVFANQGKAAVAA
jgi:acyl carrier protein